MDSHTATSRRKSRPPLTKHDTDQLLSYYHSPLADKPSSSSRPLAHRKQSTGSTSSSDYSASGDTASDYSNKDDGTTPVRRTSIPSRGAADRRRLAIVEMEPTSTITTKKTTGMNNDNLRSRRGVEASLGSLALVAPPDAAPATYTHLTPPSTAPVNTDTNNTHSSSSNSFSRSASSDERRDVDSKAHGHQRSASEAITSNNKSSPRDVGIVGTQRAPLLVETTKLEPLDEKALQPPVFIHPQSRSPSPYTPSSSSPQKELSSPVLPPMKRRSTGQSIITPDIGDEKSIDIPVASPVVVKLASNEIPQSSPSLSRPKGTLTPAPQINVVPNSPTTVFMPEVPSSYLHYQPGIHSTAGPLPPPPRASFNIDAASPPPPRPPRLRSPSPTRRDQLKQSLQLPPSVNAVLSRKSTKSPNASQTDLTRSIPSVDDTAPASTSSPDVPSPINLESPPTSQMQPKEVTISVHRREGAFAPSTILSSSPSLSTSESASVPIPIPKTDTETHDMPISASPERILVKPPPRNHSLAPSAISGLPITEDDDWVTLPPATPNSGLPKTPPDNRRHSLDSHSRDPTPSPPPKSFRNSFTHGLKRLSLNGSISRSPSIGGRRSLSHSRNGSTSSTLPPLPNDAVLSFSPTPSPSPPPMTPPPESPYKVIQPHAHRRIRDPAPAALFCHEVYTTRSASERCMIYAKKINELYLYDCGLGDWLFEAKIHGPTSSVSVISTSETPRKISHGSTMSEVTFPRRPDASLATDLTIRDPVDVTPPRGPPALPYPSLAGQRANPPKSTTSGSFASLLSGGGHASGGSSPSKQTPSKGGFFATLGRRTSVSKRDRGGGASGSSGSGRLTKPPPGSASAPPSATPLSVNKSLASIVGGPRAPPNRSSRAFTSGSMSDSPASSRQSTMLAKRPSLYNIPSESAHSASSTQTQGRSPAQQDDPAFVTQVNKLSDLLPHVERDVLAGYLRRTGQDMLAIGQYLDDEKNGCVRRD